MSDELLREQWSHLHGWLVDVDVMARAATPSGLGDWSVGDLVAHLGLSLGMVRDFRPLPAEVAPLTLAAYVSAYPGAAGEISDLTHALARRLQPDLVAGVDAIAGEAWAALAQCDATVVQGRRGPLSRADAVMSRLIELVVHGDDLARAVGRSDRPVLPAAERAVAEALTAIYRERAGHDPSDDGTTEWIRRATGRVPDPDRHLPLL